MVFGGIETERLQLNEDTLWSGAPRDWNNQQASEHLPEVRRLVAEEKYHEADQVCLKMRIDAQLAFARLQHAIPNDSGPEGACHRERDDEEPGLKMSAHGRTVAGAGERRVSLAS